MRGGVGRGHYEPVLAAVVGVAEERVDTVDERWRVVALEDELRHHYRTLVLLATNGGGGHTSSVVGWVANWFCQN